MRYDFTRFKCEINLIRYAASIGYQIDKKKSTRRSISMRKDHNDKIVISKKNGIWVYFSVYDDRDKGSIVDFIHNRTGKALADIGEELQNWLDGNAHYSEVQTYVQDISDQSPDPKRIENLFNRYSPATRHAYLEMRGIFEDILRSPRFEACIFQDQYKNAVFPHFKRGKVCALELKSERIAVFVRGSEKTLWRSNIHPQDDTMVIAEAAIDALSYHILSKLTHAFYVATSGGFSPMQSEYLQDMLISLPQIKSILIITDNNSGGDKLADRLKIVLEDAGFDGTVTKDSPACEGADWNDVLRDKLTL